MSKKSNKIKRLENILIFAGVLLGLLWIGLILYVTLYLGIFLGVADVIDAFGKSPVSGKEVAWIPVRSILWLALGRILVAVAEHVTRD